MLSISYLLTANPWLLYSIVFILGLIIGSFLNVVIIRLPEMMKREWRTQCHEYLELEVPSYTPKTYNLIKPDSTCPNCGHAITAFENIPVLSYIMLSGRCSVCHHRISIRYPVIELLTAILSMIVVFRFGYSYESLFALALTWALIALTFIDIDEQLLPDSITLPFLWLGLFLSIFGLFSTMHDSIIGAICGYLSLWSIYHLFKMLTGKEGMGYGDFKLLSLFGAWLGYQSLPLIIILSAGVGTVFALVMMSIGSLKREQPIPFGPYLASAGWIAILWGEEITEAYLHWANLT